MKNKIDEMMQKYREDLLSIFDTRINLNKEKKEFLIQDVDFNTDIEFIRGKYCIPALDPDGDIRIVVHTRRDDTCEILHSDFINNLSNDLQLDFINSIEKLREKHKLPNNFSDWIAGLVLYGLNQESFTDFNFELIYFLDMFPNKLKEVGLTTQEKTFVKKQFRTHHNLKEGRIPKYLSKPYKKLCEILSSLKNNYRRSRIDNSETFKRINYKNEFRKTYNQVSKNKKDNQKIRQRISRLKRRHKKVEK
jgi:hypothetical protein